MKIFATCLIKNEADIIGPTLEHAATWCDQIFVDDNGSDDGTWEIVQELAKKHPQIVPWRQKAQTFHNSIRGEAFREFRHLSSPGDWWVALASDEQTIDDPKQFLPNVPGWHHVVAVAQMQYYFTEKDLEEYENATGSGLVPEPAHKRLHYYRPDYAETRFFRYRPGLDWPANGAWPAHMGVMHPRLIRNRHLQYRSPEQMQKRIDVRLKAVSEGCATFRHVRDKRSWRDFLVESSSCLDDRDPNPWQIDYSKLPRFAEKPLHRLVKHFMHGTGMWA